MALVHMAIGIDEIIEGINIRALHPVGVAAIRKKMESLGFQPQFPLLVTAKGDGGPYRLIDGGHRLEAARQAGIETVYVLLHEACGDFLEEVTLARASNEASGTMIPTTMVDDAELVWRLSEQYTHEEIAQALGENWSRGTVDHYSALRAIAENAWEVILTSFQQLQESLNGKVVRQDLTVVSSPFSERLLRDILDLRPDQQLELCTNLATDTINKNKFTKTAKAYKARNAASAWVRKQLQDIDQEFLEEALRAVADGIYDEEWQKNDGPGLQLQKLIASIRERWERKYSIRLIHGDFYEEVKKLGDASIDAIIVDPPYNISTERIYTLATQADWHKNFGEWDNKSDAEFVQDLTTWAQEYFRVLKAGTTGFMFVGEPYLNIAQALFTQAGFEIKGTFYWCRTNPGPSVTKADLMPAIDLAMQFVKPGESRTFRYPGDDDGEGFNWRRFPICNGKERLLNARKETLHPTQKPEAVIQHLMQLITVPGDVVLDGFMGVGTTPAVAKRLGRKCIGIEQDPDYFTAAQHRVEA